MSQADVFKATLEAQLGEPYVLGDEGPATHDCSGLHYEGMRGAGVLWKGRPWPRETANDYKNKAVPAGPPYRVGWPVFFMGTSGHAYHVASITEVDPDGRFTGLVVPPSQAGWDKGDHSVLCGIAASELDGRSALSTGVFAESDQHRRWESGTCLGFTAEGLPGAPIPCEQDHSIEIVSDLDVTGIFAEGPVPPEPRVQSELTAEACLQAGISYFGTDEALRRSTLISTLVNPISEISWSTGSRTVNCGLMKAAEPGPFAVLRGPAVEGLLVDGQVPVAPTTTIIPPPGTDPGQPGQAGQPPVDGSAPPAEGDLGTATVPVP